MEKKHILAEMFDGVIFFGDLNYRIDLPRLEVYPRQNILRFLIFLMVFFRLRLSVSSMQQLRREFSQLNQQTKQSKILQLRRKGLFFEGNNKNKSL